MKIAIAGYGLEGESNYHYWNTPDNELTIVDERQPARELPEDTTVLIGDDVFGRLDDFDLVVRTAGLSPHKIVTNGKIWSATNEFFQKCPAPIIGVTGTKGKGTTASYIASILRAAGKTVHLVGNIGTPALNILPDIKVDDVVVYELSSFQLWDCEYSPHVAAILMIEPDHLDVHKDMSDYIQAKMNIIRHQGKGDVVVYTHGAQDNLIREITSTTSATAWAVPDAETIHVKDTMFYVGDIPVCSTDDVQLPGVHNIQNASIAIAAAWQFTQSTDAISEGLRTFKGLAHRLKLIGQVNSVQFYDDSIATTPGSALAAIQSVDGQKVLILGGVDKGGDYTELMKRCVETDTTVLAIGANGEAIELLCQQYHVPCIAGATTMREIVEQAYAYAQPRSASVILSPAAASFDMFKSYEDRGDQFIAAVDRLVASSLAV